MVLSRRDGESDFVNNIKVSKRGNITKTASTIIKAKDGAGADTKAEAENVLKKFDKSPDIEDSYINEHVKRIENGEDPKIVMKDFFKGLQKAKESSNTLSIRTAKLYRQHGIFKIAERNVYQDLESGDYWKISDDKKGVMRMFQEVDGIAEGI